MCKGIPSWIVPPTEPQGIRALGADAGAKPPAAAPPPPGATRTALEAAILAELKRRTFGELPQDPVFLPEPKYVNEPAAACSEQHNAFADGLVAPPPGLPPLPAAATLRPPPGLEPPPAKAGSGESSPHGGRGHSCGTSETGSTADATDLDWARRLTGSTADVTEEVPEPPSPFVTPMLQPKPAPEGIGEEEEDEEIDEALLAAAGVAGVPSVGSAGHHLGLCKPCDFVDRGFCRAGASCRFCHLCGPAERRQRKLQRRKLARAARRAEVTASA